MIIYVDFRDKEFYAILREVEPQLKSFGFDGEHDLIPADAIACALDEVRSFRSNEERVRVLKKLEGHYAQFHEKKRANP